MTVDTAQGSTATEHIHAMPAGSHAIHSFKVYTAASGQHGSSSMKRRRDAISPAGQCWGRDRKSASRMCGVS
jgi:hypothetical protein